jgi:hypothetical protein
MKQGMEALWGLRYKLWMMGVSVSGPSYIYGDNMSVIHNTQWPESTLKKKLNSVCYHAMRESVAMGESLTGHINLRQSRRYLHKSYPRWYEAWPSRWCSALWHLRSSLICCFLPRPGKRRL